MLSRACRRPGQEQRHASKGHRSWSPAPRGVAACLTLLALSAAPAPAATDQQVATAVDGAVAWLRAQQAADGSLGPNHGLDPAWALLGLAGAGVHAADSCASSRRRERAGLLRRCCGPAPTTAPGAAIGGAPSAPDYERAILLAGAAGVDPLRLSAQQNLLAEARRLLPRRLVHLEGVGLQPHAVRPARAASSCRSPPACVERTALIVEDNQHDDGGYTSFPATTDAATRRAASNVDSTGAALAGAVRRRAHARRPVGRRRRSRSCVRRRASDGASVDASSTSWALDGMAACGLRRGSAGWTAGDEAAVDWLLGMQLASGPDAGAWALNGFADAVRHGRTRCARSPAPASSASPPPRANPGDPLLRAARDRRRRHGGPRRAGDRPGPRRTRACAARRRRAARR